MRTTLFSIFAAISLFAAPPLSAATSVPAHDNYRNGNDYDRDDRNSKDFNFGFDKKHRVTAQEKACWEDAHRRNDERRDAHHYNGRW